VPLVPVTKPRTSPAVILVQFQPLTPPVPYCDPTNEIPTVPFVEHILPADVGIEAFAFQIATVTLPATSADNVHDFTTQLISTGI